MTRQGSYRKGYPKALWNRCALPESRVVKVNADLLAFEPLPIYIAITTPFKLGLPVRDISKSSYDYDTIIRDYVSVIMCHNVL